MPCRVVYLWTVCGSQSSTIFTFTINNIRLWHVLVIRLAHAFVILCSVKSICKVFSSQLKFTHYVSTRTYLNCVWQSDCSLSYRLFMCLSTYRLCSFILLWIFWTVCGSQILRTILIKRFWLPMSINTM